MTNAELIAKIKAEVERLENYYTSVEWYVEALLSFLSTLESEKPIQDGLEEEYKDYVESDPVYSKLVNRIAGLSIARHFAKWGAEHAREQMMKEAVKGEIRGDIRSQEEEPYQIWAESDYLPLGEKFEIGDKVRIIIVKKD